MARALVVPGHSRRGTLSRRCAGVLAAAAAVAERRAPAVVVFTGAGEAERMLAAWPGRRDVELLAEPTARTTAENAARSLRLLLERGISEATVVCAPLHAFRVRYFFGGLYARFGIGCEVRTAPLPPHPAALAHELAALAVMRRQRRTVLAELELGRSATEGGGAEKER